MNHKLIRQEWLNRIEEHLNQVLNKKLSATLLLDAMGYSSLNGGKRIRPLLSYATGQISEACEEVTLDIGCAIELIHCYSLIHDDLPAMDNDDLRRGKPTCHKKFNEAIAILAGDALQSLAFEILSENNLLPSDKLLKIINLIAKSSGVEGMAGGQAIDLANTNVIINQSKLQEMHSLKTGKLIQASILSGYLCGENYNQSIYDNLVLIASKLGLLFQIVDDIIDVTGSTEVLGKTAHKDENNHKSTYVTILGLYDAKQYAKTLYLDIMNELEKYSGAEFLIYLADLVYNRNS